MGSREAALEALKGGFAGALRDLSPGAAPFMGLLSHADWRVLLCGEEHVSGPQVSKRPAGPGVCMRRRGVEHDRRVLSYMMDYTDNGLHARMISFVVALLPSVAGA